MIPIRLKISGFLSYQQPVELDFSSFELACISGSNGAGKSSLLDAITWALFGRARKKEDDALINSSCDTAEVVYEFEYEKNNYRTQRSKTRGKTSLLELQMLDKEGNWVALTEHSLRETEKRIELTLRMDYETFINTSFFLQGKADQFAQQPAGKRKEILSSILNLEIWEEYRAATALRKRNEENEIAVIDNLLIEIETELAQESERLARLEQTSLNFKQKTEIRKGKESLVESAQRQVDLIKEYENLFKTHSAHLEDLNQQLAANQELTLARQNELTIFEQVLADEKAITLANYALEQLRVDLEHYNQLASQFNTLDQQRALQESIIATEQARIEQEMVNLEQQEHRIEAMVTQQKKKKSDLESANLELKIHEEKTKEKPVRENQFQDLQQILSDCVAENKQLRLTMDEIKSRIEELESASAACPLCGQALTDDHRLNLLRNLEAEGKVQGDRFRSNEKTYKENNELIAELKKEITALEKAEVDKQRILKTIAILETENQNTAAEQANWEKNGQKRLVELGLKIEKSDFAKDARKKLDDIHSAMTTQGYDIKKHAETRQKELASRPDEERFRMLEKARASAQPIKREISGLEKRKEELEGKIKSQSELVHLSEEKLKASSDALPNLSQMEMELSLIRSEENELRMEMARAEQEVDVLEKRRAKKVELTAQREEKAKTISQLETLERAFGKNGVPALLIEQALPDIESKANQILDQLSSGSMSLSFATLRERKNKKEDGAIQTLDILISDAAGTREYELFSGGEAFRINFAIRLALSHALAKRAGARLQTLVIDEGFGSQDADGRQRLIEAINLVMENNLRAGEPERVSDIRKILVITHLEELKDAFPARIEVEKTPQGSILQVVN
jgi:exonuclease SbcC